MFHLFLQYYCQTPETLLISSRFYWVSDIFGKIGNSIVLKRGILSHVLIEKENIQPTPVYDQRIFNL
jgi:hypothetical protein